jgi:rod shape-determining protein MreD
VSLSESGAVAGVVFVAAVLQAALFSSLDVLGGTADVLLLALIGIALSRGAVTGALLGFFGGMLLDVMTLDTLGVSALLYALAGYWTGRYGETTGRDRAHAPLLAVLVVTILVAYAGFGLHFLLGDDVAARRALLETLVPGVALNLLLAVPVFALVRAVLRRVSPNDRVTQVRFSG